MRILLIEDDEILSEMLAEELKDAKFNVEVAYTGTEGLELISLYEFQAVILDLGLPDMKGKACLSELRIRNPKVPIIILSGQEEINARLSTLEQGADDFVLKPCNSLELIARLRANIRRANGYGENILKIGRLSLDLGRQIVNIDDNLLALTPKEFEMLRLLCLQQGSVVSKNAFLDHLYGGIDEPEIKIIDVFICKLRKKLEDALEGEPFIETVWGRGYRIHNNNVI